MDFRTLAYLQRGTETQQRAYRVLTINSIFEKLSDYDPILTGTLPINIDIVGSDLDIACHWTDRKKFAEHLNTSFSNADQFVIVEKHIHGHETVLANFLLDGFTVEIFGRNLPSEKQESFRHMMIEYRVLQERGEDFRRAIIALKKHGIKTEPAFAKLLGLTGDPYVELLKLENRVELP